MEKECDKGTARNFGSKPVPAAKEKNTTMAIIAYIVCFVPLITESKADPFVKYHVKQGMVLSVAWIASGFVGMVPFIGSPLVHFLSLAILVLMGIGMFNAYMGVKKPLPLIGKFAEDIKL